MRIATITLSTLLLCLSLSSCGQKGPLYVPSDAERKKLEIKAQEAKKTKQEQDVLAN